VETDDEPPRPGPADRERSPSVDAEPAGIDAVPAGPGGPDDVPADGNGGAVGPGFGATVVELTGDDVEPRQRRRLLGRLVDQARLGSVGDLFKPSAAIGWMADAVTEIAPRLPIRDLTALRRHYDGLAGEELADRLIRNASRVSAGIGAAGGGVSAVQWAATPSLLSAPVLLAAETVTVVAIELKLVGELHRVYGVPVPGNGAERAMHLIHSWANQRGVNPMLPGVGVGAVLGTAARRELRDMLLRRFGRNLTTLGPFLTGAAVAGYLNRRATLGLADRLRTDLRSQRRALDLAHPEHPPRIGG